MSSLKIIPLEFYDGSYFIRKSDINEDILKLECLFVKLKTSSNHLIL